MNAEKQKLPMKFNAQMFPYWILGFIALVMILSGCKQYEPTQLSQNRIQVEEEVFSDTLTVEQMHNGGAEALARHYNKHGDGPLNLTVTYDPHQTTGGAMTASAEAAKIRQELDKQGVKNINASILPVMKSGAESKAIVSYTAYNALAPKDCTMMPGFNDEQVDPTTDYKLGCTVETVFAKQIARPKDLKGQSGNDPTTDGRVMANNVEMYRTGAPNQPLGGERSTGGQ